MATSAPDAELRAAAALVFVEDLGSPTLSADDAHHLGDVLRLERGEAVAAADGAGSWRICAFTGHAVPARRRTNDRSGREGGFGLEVVGPVRRQARRLPELEVGLSLAKAERTEWALAKLVELGVEQLTPIVADRTVVRPDEEGSARREARFGRIIREAAMQSRRPLLPRVGKAESLDDIVARAPAGGASPWPSPEEVLFLATPVVLVGPEGGWSPRELELVEHKVSLGDGILRVETAAVAAGVLLTTLRSRSSGDL